MAELLQRRQLQNTGQPIAQEASATVASSTPPQQQQQAPQQHPPPSQQQPPVTYLNPHQISLMHHLHQNQTTLSPEQLVMLQHLQQTFWVMQEHQKQVCFFYLKDDGYNNSIWASSDQRCLTIK